MSPRFAMTCGVLSTLASATVIPVLFLADTSARASDVTGSLFVWTLASWNGLTPLLTLPLCAMSGLTYRRHFVAFYALMTTADLAVMIFGLPHDETIMAYVFGAPIMRPILFVFLMLPVTSFMVLRKLAPAHGYRDG